MQAFLVTTVLQNDFILAITQNKIPEFWKIYREDLKKLAFYLQKVQIPVRRSKKEQEERHQYDTICLFICHNILEILQEIVKPGTIELQEDMIEKSFLRNLNFEGVQRQEWSYFYERHEQFFDTVIFWARRQKIINIYIEGYAGKWYLFLDDSRKSYDRAAREEEERVKNSGCCGLKFFFPTFKKQEKYVDAPVEPYLNTLTSMVSTSSKPFQVDVNIQNSTEEQGPIPVVDAILTARNELLGSSYPTKDELDLEEYAEKMRQIRESEEGLIYRRADGVCYVPSESVIRGDKEVGVASPVRVHRTPSTRSQASIDWEQRNREMDESFYRKLNAQNARHKEQLDKLRDERAQLNREFEERIRKLRQDSAKRIRFFLQCVALRIRWEGQQEEWDGWLKAARDPVLKVKSRFLDFTGKSFKFILRQYGDQELQSALFNFQGTVQLAHDKLVDDFGQLAGLSEKYEDKMFLKVLQRIVAEMADKLCLLLEALDGFENDESSFSRIKNREIDIHAADIPSATALRRICDIARPEDYNFVSPPREMRRANCEINEIYSI